MATTKTTVADLRKAAKTPMKEVMAQPPKQRIATLLQENKREIAAALPKHISIDRMVTIAQTAATSMPALLECYTPTLFGAMIKCTQLGLEPNNALGQAYLIPFKNTKANRMDCQLVIGYRGMLELARRSGNVVSFTAGHVREGDEFEWAYGLNETLHHVPAKTGRGEVTHYYSYAKLKGEGYQFLVWTAEDMEAHMLQHTQSRGKYGPWKDNKVAMGEKTMARMLFKWLPVSIEMAEAASLDARAEGGQGQHMEDVLSGDYTIVADVSDSPALTAEVPPEEEEIEADSNGEMFDSDIHQTDGEGDPVFNKDGSFRKKPVKAKAQAKAKAKPAEDLDPEDAAAAAEAEAAGGPPDDYSME